MTHEYRNMMRKNFRPNRPFLSMIVIMVGGLILWGCSNDMEEQPSFSYQERPRLHSPPGSIPRTDSSYARTSTEPIAQGHHLFVINCAHCHGERGMGDGAVAGYLPDLPTNLHASAVQQKPDAVLYGIVTNGLKVMPAFEPFLSQKERWALISFIRTLDDRTAFPDPVTQDSTPVGVRLK